MIYVAEMGALFVAWIRATKLRQQRLHRLAVATVAAMSLAACSGDTLGTRTSPPVALPSEVASLNSLPTVERDVNQGRTAITMYGCGSCHRIDGIPTATGRVGPTLNGIANRTMIAGMLVNTVSNMESWLLNPRAFNPQTVMPNLGIDKRTAAVMTAYLATLK